MALRAFNIHRRPIELTTGKDAAIQPVQPHTVLMKETKN